MCRDGNSATLCARYLNGQLLTLWENAVECLEHGGLADFKSEDYEKSAFTRALAQYQTPQEYWAKINDKHLALTAEAQTDNLLVANAKPPPVHRYRFPQCVFPPT